MKIFNRKKKLNLNEDAKANKILNNGKLLKENFEEEHPDFYDAIWDATEVIRNIHDELNDDYDFTAENLEYLGNKIIENGEVFIDVANKLKGELNEGIFDSREKKESMYRELIKQVFKQDANIVINDIVGNCTGLLEEVVGEFNDEGDKSHNLALGLIKLINNARTTVNKTPQSLFTSIINIGQKYARDSVKLEELVAYKSKVGKLQNSGKNGFKAMQFMFSKINEQLNSKLDLYVKTLRREFKIVESLDELNESIKTLEPIMTDEEISAVTSVPLAIASAYEDSKRADEHMEADMKEKEKVVREFLKDSEVIEKEDEYSIKLELNESLFSEANQELSKVENTASNLFTRDAAIINKINSVEGVINYLKSIRDECKTPKYIDSLIAKAAASKNLFKALELLYNVNLKGDGMGVNLKEGRAKKDLFDSLFDEVYTQLSSSPMGSAYTQYRGEYDDENELGISYDDNKPDMVGLHITSNDTNRFDSAKKIADAYNLESTVENVPGLKDSYRFIIWIDENAPAWNSPVRFKGEFIEREESSEH